MADKIPGSPKKEPVKKAEAKKPESPKVKKAETPTKTAEAPKKTEATKATESPKKAETQTKTAEAPKKTEAPKTAEAPKKTEAPKQAVAPKKAEAPKTAVVSSKTTPSTVPVPETHLKKRKRNQERLAKEKKDRFETLKSNREKRRQIFKRAEKYIKEYRDQEKSLIHLRRTAKSGGNFFIEPEPKLAFVVRIRGIIGLHPKPRKILQLLRLRQINNGTFVRLNKATKEMLRLVEPYITYGNPNAKTVRELIYKRGFGKINRQRIPITDNVIVEKSLGKYGIICVEDVIHEIYTVGPHFKEVNKFLWTFKLNPPRGGWNTIKKHYNEGGDFGNREDKINALIRRMN